MSGLFSLLLADLWPSLPGQEGQAGAQLCPHEDCELRGPYLTASRATPFLILRKMKCKPLVDLSQKKNRQRMEKTISFVALADL
jgi:hypothetical protein